MKTFPLVLLILILSLCICSCAQKGGVASSSSSSSSSSSGSSSQDGSSLINRDFVPTYVVDLSVETGDSTYMADLSVLNRGESLQIVGLGKSKNIQLQNFDLEDGVNISPNGMSLSQSSSKAVSSQGWLYTLVSSNVLASPNQGGYLDVVVSQMENDNPSEPEAVQDAIVISKFSESDGLVIPEGEKAQVAGNLVERFHTVNLSDPAWSYLDKSQVFVVPNAYGPMGFMLFNSNGRINKPVTSLFDISEWDSVSLYQYETINYERGVTDHDYRLYLVSPIEIVGMIDVPREMCAFHIPASTHGEPHQLTFYTSEAYSIIPNGDFLSYQLRTKEKAFGGSTDSVSATPYFYPSQNKFVFEIDPCEEDVYLILAMDLLGQTCRVTLDEHTEVPQRMDLSALPEGQVVSFPAFEDYLTIPYSVTGTHRFAITVDTVYEGSRRALSGRGPVPENGIWSVNLEDRTERGFFLIKRRQEGNTLPAALTLTSVSTRLSLCQDVVWSEENKAFVCNNCSIHGSNPVLYKDWLTDWERLFSGDFYSPESYGTYGRMWMHDGILQDEYGHLYSGTHGPTSEKGLWNYVFNPNDTSVYIELYIHEIIDYDDRVEIDVYLTLGGINNEEEFQTKLIKTK